MMLNERNIYYFEFTFFGIVWVLYDEFKINIQFVRFRFMSAKIV